MFIPKTAHQVSTNIYKHIASPNMSRPSKAISREVANEENTTLANYVTDAQLWS